jgi:DNA-binding XRE family transcriptional regulator
MQNAAQHGRNWKLRRIACGLRQVDLARRVGISTTRLSLIEREELEPSDLDRTLIERELPSLDAGQDNPRGQESVPESTRCRTTGLNRGRI